MKTVDVSDQAERFLAYHKKRGGSLEDDFGVWSRSKDFAPADVMAVRSAALELLVATGQAVITDMLDPFGEVA